MGKIFEEIYQQVKKIPKGRVTTYGVIARKLGIDPRVVGWALHGNRDPKCPCHRVVNRDGQLAPGYVFGGPNKQKERLLAEGVKFKKDGRVDILIEDI